MTITEGMKKELQDKISTIRKEYDPKGEWLKILIIDMKALSNMRVRDAVAALYHELLSPIMELE